MVFLKELIVRRRWGSREEVVRRDGKNRDRTPIRQPYRYIILVSI
jgi:hypothetical protein